MVIGEEEGRREGDRNEEENFWKVEDVEKMEEMRSR